jgi:hypothetical protein
VDLRAQLTRHTEYVWGVIDIVPDTNFPDVRNRTAVHSENGSCMIIPQPQDKIRLYIQLDSKTGMVDTSGNIIKSAVTHQKLLDVARQSFHPYTMEAIGEPEWFSIYKSTVTWGLPVNRDSYNILQSGNKWLHNSRSTSVSL